MCWDFPTTVIVRSALGACGTIGDEFDFQFPPYIVRLRPKKFRESKEVKELWQNKLFSRRPVVAISCCQTRIDQET
jgi:hypothetical protein